MTVLMVCERGAFGVLWDWKIYSVSGEELEPAGSTLCSPSCLRTVDSEGGFFPHP